MICDLNEMALKAKNCNMVSRAHNAIIASGKMVGLDPLTILMVISKLIPLFSSCFSQSPTHVRRAVNAGYRPAQRVYKPRVLVPAMDKVRAEYKELQTPIMGEQVLIITTKSLDQIRESTDTDIRDAVSYSQACGIEFIIES